MKYFPTYFDFEGLEHKWQIMESFLFVLFLYAVIFSVSWFLSRIPRK